MKKPDEMIEDENRGLFSGYVCMCSAMEVT